MVSAAVTAGGAWWVLAGGPPVIPFPADARGGPAPHASAHDTLRTVPAAQPLPPSRATRLAIPRLGIDAPVMGLRLDARRRLTTPPVEDPDLVGWFAAGPSPGERGTAVAVGHRDTLTGAAVFALLDRLRPGRVVEVRRADGLTAVYTVDAVRTYEKEKFPNREVYGHRDRPELRLITCGGAYDERTGYRANVVVFAHLTGARGPATAH